jgi:hypothetical protein
MEKGLPMFENNRKHKGSQLVSHALVVLMLRNTKDLPLIGQKVALAGTHIVACQIRAPCNSPQEFGRAETVNQWAPGSQCVTSRPLIRLTRSLTLNQSSNAILHKTFAPGVVKDLASLDTQRQVRQHSS